MSRASDSDAAPGGDVVELTVRKHAATTPHAPEADAPSADAEAKAAATADAKREATPPAAPEAAEAAAAKREATPPAAPEAAEAKASPASKAEAADAKARAEAKRGREAAVKADAKRAHDEAEAVARAEKRQVRDVKSLGIGGVARTVLRWTRRIAEAIVVVTTLGCLLLWCSVPNTAKLAERNPDSTAFIDLRRAQAESDGRPWKLKWTWKPIGQISRYLRAAIIYAEDYNFYRHDGVDWDAIETAIDANRARGASVVGGSTITQQLAKNLYLSPARSYVRKLRELMIAFSLEDHLSKQRILELYLNVVEWGDGVFGAEAAAQHWFGHPAISLSPGEAVRLAIALPNPFKRAPNVHTPELTKKAIRIIRCLRLQGLIDAAQERVALDFVGARGEKVFGEKLAPDAPLPIPEDVVVEDKPEPRDEPRSPPDAGEGPPDVQPHAAEPADAGAEVPSEPGSAAPAPKEPTPTPAPTPPPPTDGSGVPPS